MFDWFYDFLYLLTKSIFRLIDGLMSCCNLLCGIEPVIIDGKKTDLLTWILGLEKVELAFDVTALVGLFLIVFFSIWAIIRTVVAEKAEGTPAQIGIKAFKTVLIFLFIPLCMYVVSKSLNTLMEVLYNATKGGDVQSLGHFLAMCFGEDAKKSSDINVYTANIDYTKVSQMWQYFNMKEYDYFFSWVAGVAILFELSKVMFIFIERLYSITLLYIISPIPVSAAIIDDGAKFKTWREQLLSKFLVAYGAIIAINIYSIVTGALVTSNITFFENNFLNKVFKIVIILGGAFGLNKLCGVLGNLVSNGAGDAALNDAAATSKGVESFGKGAAKLGGKAISGLAKLATGLGGDIANKFAKGGGDGGEGGAAPDASGGDGGKDSKDSSFLDKIKNFFGGNKNESQSDNNKYEETGKEVLDALEDKKEKGEKNKKKKDMTSDLIQKTEGKHGGFVLTLKPKGNKKK